MYRIRISYLNISDFDIMSARQSDPGAFTSNTPNDSLGSSFQLFVNVLRLQRDERATRLCRSNARSPKACVSLSKDETDCNSDEVVPETNQQAKVSAGADTVTNVQDLPSKPMGREGMMNTGLIVNVINPSEFYIFPLKSWECACKEGIEDKSKYHDRDPKGSEVREDPFRRSNIEAFSEMLVKLSTFASKQTSQPGKSSVNYSANELVAVHLTSESDQGESKECWLRAIVLEKVVPNSASPTPRVKLKLVDVGIIIEKSATEIIRLPKMFCNLPPMAYRCSLFGISPVANNWTQTAINTFKLMAEFQPNIFELKRAIPVGGSSNPRDVFENKPYETEVHVKVLGKYYNVAHALASEGLALKWNLTPSRPMVSSGLDGELWNLLGVENDTPGCSLHSHVLKPDNKNVISREIKRLEKLIGRLTVDDDNDGEDSIGDSIDSSIANSVEDVLFK